MNNFLEDFFENNAILEDSLSLKTNEEFSNVFILGLPRSGTTMLSQFIFKNTNCKCINNFIARFWGTPLVGAYISKLTIKKIIGDNIESFFGQTKGLNEPHEFSKFWHKMMGWSFSTEGELIKKKPVLWNQIYEKITNLNRILESPMVWKPLELITDDIEKFTEVFKKSLFIFIDRDVNEIAISILSARNKQNNPEKFWGSIPRNINFKRLIKKNKIDQIIDQIIFLRKHYSEIIQKIPRKRLLLTSYEELCSNPNYLLGELESLSKDINGKIKILSSSAVFKKKSYEPFPEGIELIKKLKRKKIENI